MTTLAMPFTIARRDETRWSVCFALVLLAHAAVALSLLDRSEQEVFGIDAPVVTLELPASFVIATTPPPDLAPGPKEEPSEATPPAKEETKPPEAEAEVAIPEPLKPEPPQEQKLATAPPAAAVPAAVVHRWETQLLAHIERFKRYPAPARARGDQGSVQIAFSIDRDGWVRQSRILKSSGSSDLDQEALAMLTRSQPVPRPPERVAPSELSFNVPVQFHIR